MESEICSLWFEHGRDVPLSVLQAWPQTAQRLVKWGAWLIGAGKTADLRSGPCEPYSYDLAVGKPLGVPMDPRDSLWLLSDRAVGVNVGQIVADLDGHMAFKHGASVLLRGYRHPRTLVFPESATVRPYVNGCSTRELIAPARPGDPTIQQLRIPPHSSEQAHHTHSTARIVYVADGTGAAVIGMGDGIAYVPLRKGDVMVLDPFCPHHFETGPNWLEVYPLHVWSASREEADHAMMRGTALMDQGKS